MRSIAVVVAVVVLGFSTVANAQYELSAESGESNVGEFFLTTVILTNEGEDIEGYDFAVCHSEEVILESTSFDACFLETSSCPPFFGGPSYLVHDVTVTDEGFTVAAILDAGENVLPAGTFTPYSALYECLEEGDAVLTFCGDATVTVDSDVIDADTIDGALEIGPSRHILTVPSVEITTVGEAELAVILDSADGDPLIGWAFGVCHGSLVSLDSASEGETVEDADTIFTAIETLESGWIVGLLMSPITGATIEPDDDQELYVATYLATGETGISTVEICTLEDTDELDGLIIYERYALFVEGGAQIIPTVEAGAISIVEPSDEFKRGDINGDDAVTGIVDATALLSWAFLDDDEPPCLDAADADDSDDVFPLLDAVFLLNWAFNSGTAPPAPGPDECGPDPTDDSVSCLTPTDCA